jgi:DNA-binding transcriptional regulator YiaG
MTGPEVTAARQALGLTVTGMAKALGLGPHGRRTVRRWESGETPITGPAKVAITLLLERRMDEMRKQTLFTRKKVLELRNKP